MPDLSLKSPNLTAEMSCSFRTRDSRDGDRSEEAMETSESVDGGRWRLRVEL